MDILIGFIVIILAILNIILFFKIWGMTNNVAELKDFIIKRQVYNDVSQQSFTQQSNDSINESRKVTRLSDGKRLFVKYIVGDKYECFDPDTQTRIGLYKLSEIKKGW